MEFNTSPIGEYFYRIEDHIYSNGVDEWGDPLPGSHIRLRCVKIPVLKRTPKGAWVGFCSEDKRFVLLTAHKKFACPTIEEARLSFTKRKRKMISIYKTRIRHAEEALGLLSLDELEVM